MSMEENIGPDTPYGVVDNETGKVVYKTTYKNRNKARAMKDKKDLKHGSARYTAKVLEEDTIEEVSKSQEKKLKKISKELAGASKMHKSQSDRISDLLDKDEEDKEDLDEGENKNCGCGQDPCVTYGIAEELENPEKADLDKDGELSSYEKKRGKAIEKAMKKKDLKEELYEARDTRLYQKLLKKWTKK